MSGNGLYCTKCNSYHHPAEDCIERDGKSEKMQAVIEAARKEAKHHGNIWGRTFKGKSMCPCGICVSINALDSHDKGGGKP